MKNILRFLLSHLTLPREEAAHVQFRPRFPFIAGPKSKIGKTTAKTTPLIISQKCM